MEEGPTYGSYERTGLRSTQGATLASNEIEEVSYGIMGYVDLRS